ncbi:unnamed protein product [Paramecium pentaurelia]|uniref:Uncharacterized protein n=1 Tax=Paramecium pentaurelia TaxID=43138 RepID=A0A8S1UK48_9CILI|nr:unnamed protein product [Paramecium pentaurelia]
MNSEIIIGGQFDKNGLKDGWWIELNDSITNQSQVSHYFGEYKVGKKISRWETKIKFDNFIEFKVIGGGVYDQNEIKIGQWVELVNNYSKKNQVKYSGVYQKGYKSGQWYTLQKQGNDFEIVGGGFYEEGVKVGKWMELSSNNGYHFTHIGEYHQGLRINRWNILFLKSDTDDYKIIGGGSYNINGMKHGKWVEVQSQNGVFDIFAYCGEYKNGKKYGKWEILQGSTSKNQYFIIGGGSFDENGFQQGLWMDIEQCSFQFDQINNDGLFVLSIGKYQKGKKIDKWDTIFHLERVEEAKNLGGGQFDENGIKQGQWTEIHDTFHSEKQITYFGFYKDGIKVDKWETNYMRGEYEVMVIGGGIFDQNGFKQGKWMELHENFKNDLLVTYYGDYEFGKKIGRWDTLLFQVDESINNSHCNSFQSNNQENQNQTEEVDDYKEGIGFIQYCQQEFQIIGGGQFDKDQTKHGFWIENYFDNSLNGIIIKGKYNQGKKVGDWKSFSRDNQKRKIGSGYFDQNGIKQGQWLESRSYFKNESLIDFGDYKDGIKIGRWDIVQQIDNTPQYSIIGGGFYDLNGQKYGEWIDIQKPREYKNGKKFGKWDVKQTQKYCDKFKPICGGQFDIDGQKQGWWLEYCKRYKIKYMLFIGEYRNGLKIGKWEYMNIDKDSFNFTIKYGGLFDENGLKHGVWNLISRDYQSNTYKVKYQKGFRISVCNKNLQSITLF